MDHKKPYRFHPPEINMKEKSRITYLIQENDYHPLTIKDEGTVITKKFSPARGRLIVSLWVKMDIHNTGVNVVTIYGRDDTQNTQKIIQVDTEGAYFYTYDGGQKRKLCHYQSDDWYSIYLNIDTETGKYSLFIDGEEQLRNAAFLQPAAELCAISMGSYGGILYAKQIHVYPNPVKNVQETTQGRPLYDAVQSGVAADGVTVVTEQLQKLIDQCSETGGTVYLRDGIFLSGCIELKKNVTLYIEENAVLKGVLDLDAYPVRLSDTHPNWNTLVQGPQKSLIYADSQENIRILGGGTIDGSGDFPGAYGSESLRVSAILLVGCDNAEVADLYVKDAGMWTIPVTECDNLYIHDLNINSTWYPNRDGIDICDCYHVLIENCNVKADDDAICFKSGNESGCNNVLVRNTFIISTMANGIKFGTYSYGGFTNCICEDCTVKDTRTCAISIQSVDGGQIRNLQFRRIDIRNVESVFFILIADKGRTPDWGTHRIGSIEDISFDEIVADHVTRSYGSYLGGYEHDGNVYRIRNIRFHHVNVIYKGGIDEIPPEPPEFADQYPESNIFGVLPGSGYFIRHADTVEFHDCRTVVALPDSRQTIYTADATGVTVEEASL